jgi:hypothetical protein
MTSLAKYLPCAPDSWLGVGFVVRSSFRLARGVGNRASPIMSVGNDPL